MASLPPQHPKEQRKTREKTQWKDPEFLSEGGGLGRTDWIRVMVVMPSAAAHPSSSRWE